MVRNPESGDIVALLGGTEVPEWAESLIGEHLIAGKAEAAEQTEPDADADAEDKADAEAAEQTEPAKPARGRRATK